MRLHISIFLTYAILIFSACDTTESGTDHHQDDPPDNNNGETPDQTYNPEIPDDYSDYAGFADRDHWGPYNLHDPGCIKEDTWTYCFSTDASFGNEANQAGSYIQVRRSQDLVEWEFVGWALPNIPVEAFQYVTEENNGQEPGGIWAPFIMKVEDTYRLYYSLSIFGSNASYIGLLTSGSPAGPWEDQGVVVKTKHGDPMNAIDPSVVVDPNTDKHWFAYGSHWTGIYMLELDPATGKPLTENDKGHKIASSAMPHNAIEAPEIIYNDQLEKYYLFVSYGNLMDEYNIRVGRSDNPEGPYLDYFDNDLADDFNDYPILTSPYRFNNHPGWQGLGHNAVFKAGNHWFSMQQGRLGGGEPYIHMMVMHLRKIFWTDDGWPVLSPQRFANTPQDPIEKEDIIGTWEEIVLLPLSGNGAKNPSLNIEFNSDHTITGKNADWQMESENKLIIQDFENDSEHTLILSREWDWERNNLTIVYTGLNDEGVSVWGKRVF